MNDSKKYKMLTCPKGHVYSDMFDFCPECNRPKIIPKSRHHNG